MVDSISVQKSSSTFELFHLRSKWPHFNSIYEERMSFYLLSMKELDRSKLLVGFFMSKFYRSPCQKSICNQSILRTGWSKEKAVVDFFRKPTSTVIFDRLLSDGSFIGIFCFHYSPFFPWSLGFTGIFGLISAHWVSSSKEIQYSRVHLYPYMGQV